MKRRVIWAAVLGLLTALAQAQTDDCAAATQPLGRWLVEGDGFRLLFAPRPTRIRVGEHFGLDITLCARHGGTGLPTLKLDADMPAHRHGMNYRPTLQTRSDGHVRAQGLMFHMPGRWRFMFDLADERGAARLTHEVEIE